MNRPASSERGATLIEALVAVLVLSFGVLALARIDADLRAAAATSRQRAEAVRFGEEDLEHLRAFATLAASDAARSYVDIAPAARTIVGSSGATPFRLDRRVASATIASAREVTVIVSWHDAAGRPQQVSLVSMIAAGEPALTGALTLVPSAAAL